jgi:hypothetical protein
MSKEAKEIEKMNAKIKRKGKGKKLSEITI